MSAAKTLKVGLVGCGAVSALYYQPALRTLEKLGQVHVTALFDPNRENVTAIHKSFPGAKVVGDVDEMSRLGLELAIVASPPQYHAQQAIQLLKSGLAVLCEKPMALSVSEGESMVAAAASADRILAIGLVRRFMPAAQMIHRILAENIFGEVKSFSFSEGRVFRWPVQSASYFRHNGVLRDIGVHVLDLLLSWWGEPTEIAYEDDAMGGVELNCRIHLKFPQGFAGEVRLSREFNFSNSCLIECRDGQINWAIDASNKLQLGLRDSSYYVDGQLRNWNDDYHRAFLAGPVAAEFEQCFLSQLQNVIAAIRGTEPVLVPGESGLLSLKAIDRCFANRKLMHMPWLGEPELLQTQMREIQA